MGGRFTEIGSHVEPLDLGCGETLLALSYPNLDPSSACAIESMPAALTYLLCGEGSDHFLREVRLYSQHKRATGRACLWESKPPRGPFRVCVGGSSGQCLNGEQRRSTCCRCGGHCCPTRSSYGCSSPITQAYRWEAYRWGGARD